MKIYHCILKCFGFNIIDYNSLNDQNLKKALNESKNEIINKNSILKNWNDIEIFECPICLDEFQNNDDIRLLICSHKFHKKCIDLWFNKQLNCPMCKSYFS
jgi:hypothetical protein